MSLKNMTLLADDPAIAVTGGTALVFADNGITITNGVQLVVPADLNYETRRQATAKYKPPSINVATGQYGKDKKSISFAIPQILSAGRVVFNTIRVERECHPSMSVEAVSDMNKIAAQLLIDADTDGFWATGSLS